jgi:hypothetical protein
LLTNEDQQKPPPTALKSRSLTISSSCPYFFLSQTPTLTLPLLSTRNNKPMIMANLPSSFIITQQCSLELLFMMEFEPQWWECTPVDPGDFVSTVGLPAIP